MGPLLVHIPRSYGAGHLVLEKGYIMVRFGGAAARLDLDEKLYFWYSKIGHYFNSVIPGLGGGAPTQNSKIRCNFLNFARMVLKSIRIDS